MLGRKASAFALVGIAALAAICSNGSSKGHLLLAEGGNVSTFDLASSNTTLLVAPVGGNGVTLRDPAPSPDGKRIAYVRAAQPGGANPGSEVDELWIANADGTDPHVSVQGAGGLIEHPRWLDDQDVLAILRTSTDVSLERFNAGTGERQLVADGVADFALSRNRSFVVLLRGMTDLSVAAPDGSAERALVSAAAGSVVTALAVTPDDARVIYATSTPPAADLWTAPVSGGAPAHVTLLPSPAPALAYAGDDKLVYALVGTSLTSISEETGEARRLLDLQDTTTIAWAR
jgi:dipeptidyl aminopeptidase/acylaminoacyl peptidase